VSRVTFPHSVTQFHGWSLILWVVLTANHLTDKIKQHRITHDSVQVDKPTQLNIMNATSYTWFFSLGLILLSLSIFWVL